MTADRDRIKRNRGLRVNNGRVFAKNGARSVIMLILLLAFGLFVSGGISGYVIDGMKYSVLKIIPAAFPFMIVSDLYLKQGYPENIAPLRYLFTKVTHLPSEALRAYVCGSIGGFPIGAALSGKLYEDGILNEKESEYLSAVSNSPSIPFTVAVVGEGMLGERLLGIKILLINFLSSFITAYIFRGEERNRSRQSVEYTSKFNLTSSVRAAAESCIYVTAFVALFACISGVIGNLDINTLSKAVIRSLIEITTAADYITNTGFNTAFKLSLLSFALSFGGFSVMMQSCALNTKGTIGLRYIFIKLTQGLISFCLASFLLFAS